MASALGTASGGMVHVLAAALGLSAVLAQSAYAFLCVKYLGAAYLVYLGLRMLLSRETTTLDTQNEVKGRSPFWQGAVTEMLNPKTALFFLAFIPQFADHAEPLLPQFMLLGATSVALNTAADLAIVLAAHALAKRLESSRLWRKRQRQLSGATLVGLGGYVAVS